MDTSRGTALIAGALLITATVASLLGTAIEQPVLAGTDYLNKVSGNASVLSAGVLFEFIAAGTSVGIAISLYPVLRNLGAGLAIGSVVFRTIEAVMYAAAATSLLSLSAASQKLTGAASADRASLQLIGDSLLALRQEFLLSGVFAFCVGASMYYYVFYRSRLIPRWLSGWGLVAVLLMFAACLSALYSGNAVTSYAILILPIALQEMVLAVWLIARGFNPSAVRAGAAQPSVRDGRNAY